MPSLRGHIVDRQALLAVRVSKPQLQPDQEAQGEAFRALLDTGATVSAVSQNVVDTLHLTPAGWQTVTGVHGTSDLPTYAISLGVPITERVVGPHGEFDHTFSRGRDLMTVTPMTSRPSTFDVLLGMDLLEGFHLTIYSDLFILSN